MLEVQAQQEGETVKLYFNATVVVANPSITATELTVLQTSTLQGAVTVDAGLSVTGAISGFGTVPIGSVIAYGADAMANSAALQAQGWLFCDGSAVSRTTFSQLFAVLGTRHGSGDGSTTFNLPDYRGRFVRGTDHGAGRDPDISLRVAANPGGVTGDNIGSVQPGATARPAYSALTTDTQGIHTHTVAHVPSDNSSYRIAGSSLAKWTDDSATTSAAGAHCHSVVAGGDRETRPINAYVDYLIRFE
jgi:microcystin-dependent protein